nr:MAG TPA: hypothetical protein [Caudoviricetes sp.]
MKEVRFNENLIYIYTSALGFLQAVSSYFLTY